MRTKLFKENPARRRRRLLLSAHLARLAQFHSHAILILKALVPSLKSGTRILVSDSVNPPPGVLGGQYEKLVRNLDMRMSVMHDARGQTEEDCKELFKQA